MSAMSHELQMDNNKAYVFFDGVCNICNGTVNWLMERDRKDIFRFASLQSDPAKPLLDQYGIDANALESIVVIWQGKAYTKSSAALKLGELLGGIWSVAAMFQWLPQALRDAVYSFIARNRYKWFGQRDTCRIPTPEERSKFLELS